MNGNLRGQKYFNLIFSIKDIHDTLDIDGFAIKCRSGNRSKQASGKLVALGYTNIVEFGGIIDWPGEIVRGG